MRGPQQRSGERHAQLGDLLARHRRAIDDHPDPIASFAAYAFAWIDFKGRKPLFIGTVALLSIPLQVALIPLLIMYSGGAHFTIPFTERT